MDHRDAGPSWLSFLFPFFKLFSSLNAVCNDSVLRDNLSIFLPPGIYAILKSKHFVVKEVVIALIYLRFPSGKRYS